MVGEPVLQKKLALSGDSVDVLQPSELRGSGLCLSPERASLDRTMAVFNGVFPILPGKLEAERAFAEETMGGGARSSRSSRSAGVARETWWVQQTPDGNAFAMIWFESPDSEQVIAEVTRDPSEFAAWFRGQVQKLSGIELASGVWVAGRGPGSVVPRLRGHVRRRTDR